MFTHLHTHSYYSFASGTIPADELPSFAKAQGMNAVAMTDTNNMSGIMEFYIAAEKQGVKPIVGVELKNQDERAVLLAKSNDGYREICEAVTQVLEAIPQTKAKVTFDSSFEEKVIREKAQSAQSLVPFLSSLSDQVIILSSTPHILENLVNCRDEGLFLQICPSEREKRSLLREIYQKHHIPPIATNDAVMGRKSDLTAHRLLRAISLNTNLGLLPKTAVCKPDQYFASEQEMRNWLSGISEEAFNNIGKVAEQCNVEFDLEKPKFAKFQCDDSKSLLRSLAEKGLWNRFPNPKVEHIQRFSHELGMINQLGATDYFLAVEDMIQYARRKDYPYLARGSGANSFIAYCLGITNVDPVQNNLTFERFLNPERQSPPDFDIDFSWKDRYEVINFMLDKYGRENSAMLCTIQTYKDKGSVREIGKALGYGDGEIKNFYRKLSELKYTGGENLNRNASSISNSSDMAEWLLAANKIIGFPRHLSVHAGGIILADKSIYNYCPTQMSPIGVPITQQDMFSADDWRLIKLDILATRGLGTYWDTMKLVKKRTGKPVPVEDVNVALNDKRTIASIREGKTKGCFYIESPAMLSLLKKLQVGDFKMLTAASSVVRPGVSSSGMMQEFIARHHNKSRIKYAHPKLGELLKDTYGIMIYQEDVLNVVHELAGLSYGQADMFRRAMSGKLRSKESLQVHKKAFVDGCVKKGVQETVAHELWRQISSFYGYSFCKAHSASYAVLSFQEAWLKVHYPTEFLCSVLNNYGGFYNHQEYVNEAKALDIEVLLPCVNRSAIEHTVEQDHVIRIGFEGIKEVSQASKETIILNRQKDGRYISFDDFVQRSGCTPEDGRILISIGACDAFGMSRPHMQVMFAYVANHHSKSLSLRTRTKRRGGSSQTLLALDSQMPDYDLSHLSNPSAYYNFRLEKQYLTYSVSHHPCDFLDESGAYVPANELKRHVGRRVVVQGYIASTKHAVTKAGDNMALLNVADRYGMIDVVVWPNEFKKYYNVLQTSEALSIVGRVQESYGAISLIAESIEKKSFTEAEGNKV